MKEKKIAREERNQEKLANGDWVMAEFYTVESTPTFILFRKGQQLWRQSGELPLERLERAVKGFKS